MQAGNTAPREEYELRLESDEKAVRIITVHKSKGLEFDVVFCPYVWSDAKPRAAFHDPEANDRLTLDLAEKRRPQTAPGKGSAGRSAAAFLRRGDAGQASLHDGLERERQKRTKCAPAYLLGEGGQPSDRPRDEIAIAEVPAPNERRISFSDQETAAALEARKFTGAIDRSLGHRQFHPVGQRTRGGCAR